MITNTYSVSVPLKNPLVDINNNLLKHDNYITILEDKPNDQEFMLYVRQGNNINFEPNETYLIYLRKDTHLSYKVFHRFKTAAYDQPEDIVLKINIKDEL